MTIITHWIETRRHDRSASHWSGCEPCHSLDDAREALAHRGVADAANAEAGDEFTAADDNGIERDYRIVEDTEN